MNKKTKTILGIVIFVAFLGIIYSAYHTLFDNYNPNIKTELADETPKQEKGEKSKAPDFTVFNGEGDEVNLSDFAGKPVVLNFWASWCPPCKAEMPNFDKVYAELKEDIVFMMVDLVDGQRETEEKGQKYIEDQGYSFPVYFDIGQEAAYIYGISSIPSTFFIDADGNIIYAHGGPMDEEMLKAAIDLIKK